MCDLRRTPQPTAGLEFFICLGIASVALPHANPCLWESVVKDEAYKGSPHLTVLICFRPHLGTKECSPTRKFGRPIRSRKREIRFLNFCEKYLPIVHHRGFVLWHCPERLGCFLGHWRDTKGQPHGGELRAFISRHFTSNPTGSTWLGGIGQGFSFPHI